MTPRYSRLFYIANIVALWYAVYLKPSFILCYCFVFISDPVRDLIIVFLSQLLQQVLISSDICLKKCYWWWVTLGLDKVSKLMVTQCKRHMYASQGATRNCYILRLNVFWAYLYFNHQPTTRFSVGFPQKNNGIWDWQCPRCHDQSSPRLFHGLLAQHWR